MAAKSSTKPARKRPAPAKPARKPASVKRSAQANGPAPQPARVERIHVDPAEVKTWVESSGLKRKDIAAAVGMKVFAPIGVAIKGRPLSPERFQLWRERLAAHQGSVATGVGQVRTRKATKAEMQAAQA